MCTKKFETTMDKITCEEIVKLLRFYQCNRAQLLLYLVKSKYDELKKYSIID